MHEFMERAIEQAKRGAVNGGIPIGSILVENDIVVGTGYNKRVQCSNPILHAEIDCLQSAGRRESYKKATLYSTLMPCYMCAGAVVQFGIPKVVVGENVTFKGAKNFLEEHNVEVVIINSLECKHMMKKFIKENSKLWNEDIGK